MQSYLPKVCIHTVCTKTQLSLMSYLNFQNNHNTGVDNLVSVATKRLTFNYSGDDKNVLNNYNNIIIMKIYLFPS